MNDFNIDLNTESIVGKWMVDNFWSKCNGQRVSDIDKQKSGIDVELYTTNKVYNIDEKIKNKSSINQPMFAYPSVEILPNKDNTNLSGWWINPNEQTDLYCYLNISADNTNWKTLEYEQITGIEAVLFSKKQLKEWQYNNVGTDVQIYNDACYLADDDYEDRNNYYKEGHKTAHLKKSQLNKYMKQQPINLVIGLDKILSLKGTKHYIIKTNGVQKI